MEASSTLKALIRVRKLCHSGEARDIRVSNNLSLADVGSAIDVPPATIHRWETKQRRPHGDAALRYGDLLIELRRSR